MEVLATTVKEAAKALSLGRTTIYVLIRQGRLKTIKLGRRTLITTASLQQLLSEPARP